MAFRQLLPLLCLSLLLVVPSSSTVASASADWPTVWSDQAWSRVQPAPGDTPVDHYGVVENYNLGDVGESSGEDFVHAVAVDLDGDRDLELLTGWRSSLLAVDGLGTGEPQRMWEREFEEASFGVSQPAIADLTGDGTPEVAIMTSSYTVLYVLDGASGEVLVRMEMQGTYPPAQPVTADLDGDGVTDLVYADRGRHVVGAQLVQPQGNLPAGDRLGNGSDWELEELWRFTFSPPPERGERDDQVTGITNPLLLGDVTGDGGNEVVAAAMQHAGGPPSEVVALDLGGDAVWQSMLEVSSASVRNVGNFLPQDGGEVVIRFLAKEERGPPYYQLLNSGGGVECDLGAGSYMYDGGLALDTDGDGVQELGLVDRNAHTYAPSRVDADEPTEALLLWDGCEVTRARELSTPPETSSDQPTAADLDGDGAEEILLPRPRGEFLVLNRSLDIEKRIQLQGPDEDTLYQSLSADLTADGSLEVLAVSARGRLHLLDAAPDISVEKAPTTDGRAAVQVTSSGPGAPHEVNVGFKHGGNGGGWGPVTTVELENGTALVPVESGPDRVTVKADPNDRVHESNESNNVVTLSPVGQNGVVGPGTVGAITAIVLVARSSVSTRKGRRP